MNALYKIKRLFSMINTKYVLKKHGVRYGQYRIVGTPIIEVGKGDTIVLGNNLCMNNGLLANQIGFNSPCVLRTDGGSIFIGENVGMSQTTLIATGADITIGNYVLMGGGVKIYTTDFHSLDYQKRRDVKADLMDRKCALVSIGDDCFIGAGVMILKGVSIGKRSVIGAGSVVTKDIPDDSVAAGNPCRVISQIAR